jgi:hypothetical protein
MTDEAIKAALEESAQAVCRWPDGLSCNSSQPSPACENCRGHAAAAVAAFLRALPNSDLCTQGVFSRRWIDGEPTTTHMIAAAVERAAQEARDANPR